MTFARLDAAVGAIALWLVRAGGIVLAAMMLMTFMDVVGRYLFNHPLTGTVDLTELFMGLIVFFGIGHTTMRQNHIAVDLLTSRLTGRLATAFELFAQAVAGALGGLICWQLWIIAGEMMETNTLTRIWEYPVYPVAYAMAAASVVMVSAFALRFAATLAALLKVPEA